MDLFTDELRKELKSMKEGNFNELSMDRIINEMPDDFVLQRHDFSIIIETFKALNIRSPDNHKMVYDFYKQCFDHIDDPDVAVVEYFDSCKDIDYGPFGTKQFPTGTLHNQIERSIGNHNQACEDECKIASKILAWLLICDPEETLKYFLIHAIQSGANSLPFIIRMFAHLPLICSYEADFKFFKGNIFLNTLQDIIQLPSIQQNPTSLHTIQSIIVKLTFPRDKKAPLVSPNLLLDLILLHLSQNKMPKYWLEIFQEVLKKLGSKEYIIKWDFSSSKLSRNPVNLCVFLLKLFAKGEFKDSGLDQVFQALGKHFKAHDIKFNNTAAFKVCVEIDWATKFSVLEQLSIPSTSYRREIPQALYFVLSNHEKQKYYPIEDSLPTFENYLISLFELFIIGENIPDEFTDNVSLVHDTMNDSCVGVIAVALFRAFTNISGVRNVEFKESTLHFVDKLINKLDCPFGFTHVHYVNREIFEAIVPLQSILILGKGIRAYVINESLTNPSKAALTYSKFKGTILQKLLLAFCFFVNKVVQSYRVKLHPVTSYSRSQHSRPNRLPQSTYITMTTVFGVLKSAVDPLHVLFSSDGPDELSLLMNNLSKFMDEILCELEHYYPASDLFTRECQESSIASADQINGDGHNKISFNSFKSNVIRRR